MRFLNDVGYPYACDLLGVYRDSEHTYAAASERNGLRSTDTALQSTTVVAEVVTTFATEGDLFSWCEVRKSDLSSDALTH